MNLRHVTVTIDLVTNLSIRELKSALLTRKRIGLHREWQLQRDRNDARYVKMIAKNYPAHPILYYPKANKVKVRK